MYYETTKELLAFIKKSPTAFHAVEEMQTDGRWIPGAFGEGTLEAYPRRKICGDAKSFCADRFYHTGEGILEVSYHRQPQ